MGFFRKRLGIDITGGGAADAARNAAVVQSLAAEEGGETRAQAIEQATGLFSPLGFGGQPGAGGFDRQISDLESQIAELQQPTEFSGGILSRVGDVIGDTRQARTGELQTQLDALRQQAQQPGQPGIGQLGLERAESLVGPQFGTGLGAQGLEQAGFLTDPQQQFDFLQNNPLFQLALENANQRTQQQASAGRRLSFGDTLQQLSNNVLLSAAPLIGQQRAGILDLLGFGERAGQQQRAGVSELLGIGERATTNVANLIAGAGAARAGGTETAAGARAGGIVGAGNVEAGTLGRLVDLAGGIGGGIEAFRNFGRTATPVSELSQLPIFQNQPALSFG
ncbi:MAG: hypothetical protein V3W52_17345 [Syntrophobacteria bacterium]